MVVAEYGAIFSSFHKIILFHASKCIHIFAFDGFQCFKENNELILNNISFQFTCVETMQSMYTIEQLANWERGEKNTASRNIRYILYAVFVLLFKKRKIKR